MPRIINGRRIYSQAEKAAYYKKKASSYVPRISGRGDYSVFKRRIASNYRKPYRHPGVGRKIGRTAGRYIGDQIPFIGSQLGGMVGGLAGQAVHSGIKTITGYGDYVVKENSVLYNRDAVPQFGMSNPRCTIIAHREFVTDINGSTLFNIDTFNINASNPAIFPWLSQVARNYEQVVWQGLVFEFKTTCATAIGSTNTALGTVVMATQYDSKSAPFLNKQQMENYEFAQSTVPSQSIMHAIECDPKLTYNQGMFYIPQPDDDQNDNDSRMSDIGRFSIATVGMQAISTIGELWVTYKVCLLKPKLTSQVLQADAWNLDTANITATAPYGDTPQLRPQSTSAAYNSNLVASVVYTDPPMSDQNFTAIGRCPWFNDTDPTACFINPSFTGFLLVVYELHGGSIPKGDPLATSYGNCTIITLPTINEGPFITYQKTYSTAPVVNYDAVLYTFVVRVTGGYDENGFSPYFTLTAGVPASPTQGALVIYSIPGNLYYP